MADNERKQDPFDELPLHELVKMRDLTEGSDIPADKDVNQRVKGILKARGNRTGHFPNK